MLTDLKVVESARLPPEGGGTIRALSRIGYELPDALADLIDNSVDAGANRVDVTIYRDDVRVTSVTIADDGRGMNAQELRLGMQFAGRTDHDPHDLGAFGLGLKSASFSQCQTLTVISRKAGAVSAARWSVEQIGKDWHCEILDALSAEIEFRNLCLPAKRPSTGTLVIWDRLTRLEVAGGDEGLDTFLSTAMARIENHLGLVFHRFLASGALVISVTVRHQKRTLALPRMVKARDPFDYPVSGAKGWPQQLNTTLPGVGELRLAAHIWPPGSLADGYLLGFRSGTPSQGFYFYRNNRIIQAGGWNGVVRNDQDPDLALARVAVELPPGGLQTNVQKSGLQVTASQAQALSSANVGDVTFEDYLDVARGVCVAARRVSRSAKQVPLVPGQGFPMPVRRQATKLIAGKGPHQEIDFVWDALDDGEVFRLDLGEARLLLNKTYRRDILGESAASSADAPVLKMLLFLLLRDDFGRLRFSAKRNKYLESCNSLILKAIKS